MINIRMSSRYSCLKKHNKSALCCPLTRFYWITLYNVHAYTQYILYSVQFTYTKCILFSVHMYTQNILYTVHTPNIYCPSCTYPQYILYKLYMHTPNIYCTVYIHPKYTAHCTYTQYKCVWSNNVRI